MEAEFKVNHTIMEDLTNAILTQLNPKPGTSGEMQVNAKAYCMKVIQNHHKNYLYFFNLFQTSSDIFVKFWSLGAIEEIIKNYYNAYDVPLRKQLHECYLQIIERQPAIILCSPYIEAKYASLFCTLLKEDYPNYWPDAFTRLLSLLKLEVCTNPSAKMQYISFIFNCLLAFDREIVDFRDVRLTEEHKKGVMIKDEMRKNVVNDIAFLIQQIIQNYEFLRANSFSVVIGQALEVLEKTVDWVKVELFTENLPFIIQFLGIPELQVQAAKSLYAIIDKGMDPAIKISLLKSLNLIFILSQWNPKIPGHNEDFQKAMANIVNKIGLMFLDYLADSKVPLSVKQVIEENFPIITEMGFKYLDQEYSSVSVIICEFLNKYLNLLKKITMQEFHTQSIKVLLEIVMRRVQLPSEYFTTSELPELEESFVLFRGELTTVFVNMSSIPSIQQGMIEYINQAMEMLKTQYKALTGSQKEMILYLFYRLGQAFKELPKILKEPNTLTKMVEIVLDIPEIFMDHLLIVSTALEVVIRYALYLKYNETRCDSFVGLLLSER